MRRVLVLVILCSLLTLSGCIYIVAGGVGVLGGYIISPDTVEGTTSRDQEEVWAAALEIANIMGKVADQNENRGEIQAIIANARVWITVVPVSTSTAKLRVKARKAFMPKIDIAQDVYAKIVKQLDE